ncbi:MAG: DMT family transporter [Bacillota bacterium]
MAGRVMETGETEPQMNMKQITEGRGISSEKENLQRPPVNPYLVLFIAIVGLSFGSFLAKLSDAPALIIATYRNGFATVILTPFALFLCRHEFKNLSLRDGAAAFVSGVFLAFHFATWILSLDYTSVASSTVLVTLQPVFVVLGSYIFLKETVSKKALLAGLLAIVGSVIIGLSDFRIGGMALWGDFLALSGAVLIAVYMLIGRRLRQRLSLTAYTFLVYGACSVTLLLMDILTGTPLAPYSAQNWLLFLAMALIPTIMGHSLLNWNLKYLPASTVSVSVLGEPIGASILAGIFLHEMPAGLQVIGAGLILIGIYLFMKLQQ